MGLTTVCPRCETFYCWLPVGPYFSMKLLSVLWKFLLVTLHFDLNASFDKFNGLRLSDTEIIDLNFESETAPFINEKDLWNMMEIMPTDLSFKIGSTGHTFNVHKQVIRNNSYPYSVFLNEAWASVCPTWTSFDQFDEQGRLIIKIWNAEPETFKLCINFLYTGHFLREISLSEGLELLKLADCLEIPRLLAHMSLFLRRILTRENSEEILKALEFLSRSDFDFDQIKIQANKLSLSEV